MNRISFVIPVRNDADRLRACLASIAANAYPRELVEVVVADNGSSDESPAVARTAGTRLMSLPAEGVSALRNTAARTANGDVLAFVDADHEIAGSWIEAAVDAFADGHVGAVGALCVPPPHGTWVQRAYGWLRGRTIGRAEVDWLGAGNMAVRREAFEQVGGFDEGLHTCEDVDLCQRLKRAGWRVLGDERLHNVHLGDPPTLARLFRGERWRGRDNLRVSLRGSRHPRELPSLLIPIAGAAALLAAAGGALLAPFVGWPALMFAAAGAALLLLLALARALRMMARANAQTLAAFVQAFAVALTYDLARASALLGRSPHHRSAAANGA